MAIRNVNSIAASSELVGDSGMVLPDAALKRFTARGDYGGAASRTLGVCMGWSAVDLLNSLIGRIG